MVIDGVDTVGFGEGERGDVSGVVEWEKKAPGVG